MGLIKSNLAPSSLSPFSMADIEQAAQRMLLRARGAAEQLLAEAQREADLLKASAVREGFAAGQRDGMLQGLEDGKATGHATALAEVKSQLTLVWQALTEAVQALEASRQDLEAAGLTEVIDLSSNIARRVTKRQAAIDPAVLTENMREAMKFAVQAADVRIVIHPSQLKTMTEELPKLQMTWPNLKHVELMQDASILPGGCRILTRHGEVDAQIDEQLERVIGELLPRVVE